MTFHTGEQNELEDDTKNIESKTWQELTWGLTKNKVFWYHETIMTNPLVKKSEIDQLQKWIDELHQFQGKESSNEVPSP
jgi:hypothetical protein